MEYVYNCSCIGAEGKTGIASARQAVTDGADGDAYDDDDDVLSGIRITVAGQS